MTDRKTFWLAAAIVGAITLARIAVLIVSPLDLYPDEAQYWSWSLALDWGYFSKPPFIAWLIRAATSICGDGEACIRVGSPLLHGATALVLFAIGKLLYDARTGLWTAIAYITTPGVSYSSGLVSTDVPLLFFWSVALLAFLKAMRTQGRAGWGWGALCGVAIGLGLLSKYAMLYFVLAVALTTLIVPESRRLILSWRGLLMAFLALVVVHPNIVWNIHHGFATVAHTANNADWARGSLHLMGPIEFLLGQFGVFGPLMMGGYLYGLWRMARGKDRSQTSRILACFSLPALVIIVCQAVIADANANWAAAAYVAATPFAVHALMPLMRGLILKGSVAFHALMMIAIMAFAVSPALAAQAGFANAYKRLQGWRGLGNAVAYEASKGRYQAIVADNRSVMASLTYYARPRTIPILMWNRDERVSNYFEMTSPLTSSTSGRVLLVTDRSDASRVLSTFKHSLRIGDFTADLGGGKKRMTHLYEAEGYASDVSKGDDSMHR